MSHRLAVAAFSLWTCSLWRRKSTAGAETDWLTADEVLVLLQEGAAGLLQPAAVAGIQSCSTGEAESHINKGMPRPSLLSSTG